jgi:F-type H+-transporting ATPase subunit alpha
VRGQIARGERIRALITQPRYAGLRLADQVAVLAGLADGALDAIAPDALPELRRRLPDWLDSHAPAAAAELAETGALTDEIRHALVDAVAALAADIAPEQPGRDISEDGDAP